jgi:hypothetical protein
MMSGAAGRKYFMKGRDFYEWCFREQGRGDQEKEKQLNRLERPLG